ncbi:unnamed protein product [Dibothriocephalus latus]|uniref:Uncharacterized protein n=1 Tax=Dibothriocephalus latus TaxID=60516 RepID=A0A3P6R316_DIBLA|nr:unnamed protein product [Dibothriocephalus latus]
MIYLWASSGCTFATIICGFAVIDKFIIFGAFRTRLWTGHASWDEVLDLYGRGLGLSPVEVLTPESLNVMLSALVLHFVDRRE